MASIRLRSAVYVDTLNLRMITDAEFSPAPWPDRSDGQAVGEHEAPGTARYGSWPPRSRVSGVLSLRTRQLAASIPDHHFDHHWAASGAVRTRPPLLRIASDLRRRTSANHPGPASDDWGRRVRPCWRLPDERVRLARRGRLPQIPARSHSRPGPRRGCSIVHSCGERATTAHARPVSERDAPVTRCEHATVRCRRIHRSLPTETATIRQARPRRDVALPSPLATSATTCRAAEGELLDPSSRRLREDDPARDRKWAPQRRFTGLSRAVPVPDARPYANADDGPQVERPVRFSNLASSTLYPRRPPSSGSINRSPSLSA